MGGFVTKGPSNTVRTAPHPAYTKPTLASAQMRAWITGDNFKVNGDPVKAVSKVYELSKLKNPPLRLALGKETISAYKDLLSKMDKGLDEWASWSEGLELN
ncbi:hypothetical protein NM688_g8844 [Phlebia brevispora]|uniref:Uncharacterized protein n=1 Tax=Phlebia brevispora TaxID=194682 RepID=A0ACC1RMS6_9APHY|nr:hypothetical protein NM688_g8844 [Phlebia brevispora]